MKKKVRIQPLVANPVADGSTRFSLAAPNQRDHDLFEYDSMGVAEALCWLAFGQPWRLDDWIPRLIPNGEIWQVDTRAWLSDLCKIEPAFLQPAEVLSWMSGSPPESSDHFRSADYDRICEDLRHIGITTKSQRFAAFKDMEFSAANLRG